MTALVAVLLGGCTGPGAPQGTEPPAPSAAALPKYYDPGPMLTDVRARTRTDTTAVLSVAGTLTGPAGSVPVDGEGALRLAPTDAAPAVRLELRTGPEGSPRPVGLVRVGDHTWLRPPGAPWGERVPPGAAPDATLVTNVAAGVDPLAPVARYPDAVLVADAVGDPVGGVPAVRYTLVVDLVRAIATENDPARREALAAQHRTGTTRISTEIWLDAERRPLRVRMRQQLPDAGVLDLLLSYRDWGAPVTIAPPGPG